MKLLFFTLIELTKIDKNAAGTDQPRRLPCIRFAAIRFAAIKL
ncbi:hypothetical protein CFter6_3481 [Collimonas fungivorans]|uniref:Uncharacterized protein n=1 Tax=Collimonas fungivorans TaxID=158899 RepID=A0A127PES1_9BURK|nr:hypothetical protein CFter6_3481 [Collimonas fungivorans]